MKHQQGIAKIRIISDKTYTFAWIFSICTVYRFHYQLSQQEQKPERMLQIVDTEDLTDRGILVNLQTKIIRMLRMPIMGQSHDE